MARKYYHTSPYRLPLGTVLTGQIVSFEIGIPSVWMTGSEVPHYTIFEEASNNNWHVYEVVPMDKVYIGKVWDEYITSHCQIVKYIGNSKGICKGHKKGSGVFPKRQDNYNIGKFTYLRLNEMIKKLSDLYPDDTKVINKINKVKIAYSHLLENYKNTKNSNLQLNINQAKNIVSKEEWKAFDDVLQEFVDFYSKKV